MQNVKTFSSINCPINIKRIEKQIKQNKDAQKENIIL